MIFYSNDSNERIPIPFVLEAILQHGLMVNEKEEFETKNLSIVCCVSMAGQLGMKSLSLSSQSTGCDY